MKVFNFESFLQQKTLNEQVYTDFDKKYDYKEEGGTWFTKRKEGGKWINITNRPEAVDKLNARYFPDKKPVKTDKKTDKKDQKVEVKPLKKDSTVFVSNISNPDFIEKLSPAKLDSTKSNKILSTPDQTQCAQFVNDFNQIKKRTGANVGDAWIAKDNSKLGTLVYNVFQGLNETLQNKVIALWNKIQKKGGGKEGGSDMTAVKSVIEELIKKNSFSNTKTPLQLGDVVGIYYPPSRHHEESFHQAGKIYFTQKGNEFIPGKTIKGGEAWGMNTHLGTIGAISNNKPMVFHNIGGKVFADPVDKIKDGGKIVWVRRPSQIGQPVKLA
jgi:hypothetical protein